MTLAIVQKSVDDDHWFVLAPTGEAHWFPTKAAAEVWIKADENLMADTPVQYIEWTWEEATKDW